MKKFIIAVLVAAALSTVTVEAVGTTRRICEGWNPFNYLFWSCLPEWMQP